MALIKEAITKLPSKRIVAIMAWIAACCLWVGLFTKQSAVQVFGQAWQYLNVPYYLEFKEWVTSHPPVFTILSFILALLLIVVSLQTKDVLSSNANTVLYLWAFVDSMRGNDTLILVFVFIICWILVVCGKIKFNKKQFGIGFTEWLKSKDMADDIVAFPITVVLVLVYPILLLGELLNVK